MGSRRGGTLGRPFVDGAARPGGRALQKESVPERRRGQAPALHRWKHSKLGISFQGGRPHGAAHTEENKLGALARQSQAQKMNRNGVRGKATMSTKCSSGAVPGGVLVTLPPRAKSLAARRRRNFPVHNQFNPNPAPSSVWPSASHLPPRGKAEREEAKHSFAQNSFACFSFKKSRRR